MNEVKGMTAPSNVNQGSPRPKKRGSFVSLFFLTVLVVLAYSIGVERGKSTSNVAGSSAFSLPVSNILSNAKDTHPDLGTFWKTWDILHERFVDSEELDSTALVYGAIKGMLSATDDPYTTFFDPEENKAFNEDISGSFEGIGAEIGIKNKILTIVAPLDDAPAEQAGLRAGDKVFEIDDQNTAEMTIDEAKNKMRGKKGTEVKLTIFRDGDKETRDIVIRRDVINVKSVKLSWKDDAIALVRINQFGEGTVHEFEEAVKEVRSRNARGILLDLRDNPGGLLDGAVDIASRMIPKKSPVVLEEDGEGRRETLSTRGGDVLSGTETVVLINEGSASASEILAAALRENRGNVTLIGKKSFGKGSVQELVSISNETALKVTVARWLTPKGKQINKEGIAPDIEVEFTNEDYDAGRDPQLDRALEVVREKIR